jgi:trehalose 6-phosphate synthase/phosphatase
MAQVDQESPEFTLSPRPLLPESQTSIHPGLRPSLVNIPVTPGIGLGEYEPESTQNTEVTSYFTAAPQQLQGSMEAAAQSPSEAAAGATTNADILRRMSLSSPAPITSTPVELDPQRANPALGLSGNIISATFCIPHAVKLRKGSDWV